MFTSRKFTHIVISLFFLVTFASFAFGQDILDVRVSDQKAGSLLAYPYYTSRAQDRRDTRVSISNIGPRSVTVHMFMLDGSSCNQADQFVCLTPNASIAFKASELDPEVTGWVLAVAVDSLTGYPITANSLIGNALVTDGDYVGNYGAEAFWSKGDPSTINPATSGGFGTATLNFNGGDTTAPAVGGYDFLPSQFAIELQSTNDSTGQKLITIGMTGDITSGGAKGAGQVGIGQIYNGNEKPFGSFSKILNEGCQATAVISASVPRVPLGMTYLIPAGQVGTMKFFIGGGVGLLMTPKTLGNKWSGIRALHKTSTVSKTLTIPVFTPAC
ncbi:MAG: hypothetical protein JST84_30760 [Acidobacteria bacterium]|nr:hypothetical protein [Acidobacteriota bacterium]